MNNPNCDCGSTGGCEKCKPQNHLNQTNKEFDRGLEEEVKHYAEKINSGELQLKYLQGAYGDTGKDNLAIVVEDIFPEDGGAYNKLLGCSYLFKTCPFGIIPTALIELYGLAKKMVSKVIIDITKDKFLLSMVLFFYIFRKKKFYAYLNDYVNVLHSKVMGIIPPDTKRFNTFQRELRRVNFEVFKGEAHLMAKPLQKLFEIVIYLTDFDTAYRFPAQDVLENVNKDNPPRKEFVRLCKILEERAQHKSFKEKVGQLKRIRILFYHPFFKRILSKALKEINIDKVRLDEADWYFCLRRKIYNFRGIDAQKREEEANKIDKEKGHIPITFTETNEKGFKKAQKNLQKVK